MHGRDGLPIARGFTLIEVLVALVILGIAMALGIPALSKLITRSRLEGSARELAVLTQRARLEAIKRRVQTVVEVDPATGAAEAWADVDGPGVLDPPDLVFNPVAGELRFTTDYRIGRLEPGSGVRFEAPGGQSAVDGLSAAPGRRVAVFLPTGAADRSGAFRLADPGGLNHLEVRLAPAGTGRVTLRKWDRDAGAWALQREGGKPWTWYIRP
jgi:prepilin-type N-terminal cleavage/methylation domain-containing protein